MAQKRVVVVAGGAVTQNFLRTNMKETDIVIGADYGVVSLLDAGIIPHIAIGDFDTAGEEKLQEWKSIGIKIVRLLESKDVTDTHAAVEEALSYDPKEIYLYGMFGGSRMDHTLANIGLLEFISARGAAGIIQDETNLVRLLQGPGKVNLINMGYTYVSIVPISKKLTGVYTTGLAYPLTGQCLVRGQTRSISNQMVEETAAVSIENGKCYIIQSKD
jgi:thiamine pyrophosphokinase